MPIALWEWLVLALGLVLVAEGVLYALFPDFMRKLLALALIEPVERLRLGAVAAAAVGVGLVWLVLG